jgi:hypothetical protein
MKNLFNISDIEKSRILNLHESSTKRHYLPEQVVTNHDSKYDYKKEGDKYFFKLKNSGDWRVATGDGLEAIKTKVFKTQSSSNKPPSENNNDLPFKTKGDGDKFRLWMNKYYPKTSKKLQLDPSGSHTNSYIKRAWNTSLTDEGTRTTFGELYTKKVLSKGGRSDVDNNNIKIMPGFNPKFKSEINFDNLKVNDTTNNFCVPNDKECGQFVNDISDDISPGDVGNAWNAYVNTTKLGDTIYSSFKNISNRKNEVIKLWQQINNRPDDQKWQETGPLSNTISNLVNNIVPNKYSGPQLKVGDVVGIYNKSSKNHERAFYEGGKRWFVNGEPGNTIKKGEGWGMNTHIGRVAVVKDGIPLIFHNVDGTTKSDPPQNLRISWVKRKGGSVNENFLAEQPDSVMDRRLGITSKNNDVLKKKQKTINELKSKYSCVNDSFLLPLDILIKKGYNKDVLKLSLGIIGRESSFASGKRYTIINPVKELWSWLGGDTSVGPGQMKGDTAKDLGLDLEYITTNLGSLDGVYQYLYKSIKKSKTEGYVDSPSSLGNIGTGNGMYDISIASYNIGQKNITKWCQPTDPERLNKGLKNRCSEVDQSKQKMVKNYIPNFKTKRWDEVETTTHGYVKEVSDYYKTYKCF